jgi:hypothetical protein
MGEGISITICEAGGSPAWLRTGKAAGKHILFFPQILSISSLVAAPGLCSEALKL